MGEAREAHAGPSRKPWPCGQPVCAFTFRHLLRQKGRERAPTKESEALSWGAAGLPGGANSPLTWTTKACLPRGWGQPGWQGRTRAGLDEGQLGHVPVVHCCWTHPFPSPFCRLSSSSLVGSPSAAPLCPQSSGSGACLLVLGSWSGDR